VNGTSDEAAAATRVQQSNATRLSERRLVHMSVTLEPVSMFANPDAQLAWVKSKVLWLSSVGFTQWAADGDIDVDAAAVVACETGSNGRAGFQMYLPIWTTLRAEPTPPILLAAAKKLLNKERIKKEQILRNNAEIHTRKLVAGFVKSSRGLGDVDRQQFSSKYEVITPGHERIVRGYTLKEHNRPTSFAYAVPNSTTTTWESLLADYDHYAKTRQNTASAAKLAYGLKKREDVSDYQLEYHCLQLEARASIDRLHLPVEQLAAFLFMGEQHAAKFKWQAHGAASSLSLNAMHMLHSNPHILESSPELIDMLLHGNHWREARREMEQCLGPQRAFLHWPSFDECRALKTLKQAQACDRTGCLPDGTPLTHPLKARAPPGEMIIFDWCSGAGRSTDVASMSRSLQVQVRTLSREDNGLRTAYASSAGASWALARGERFYEAATNSEMDACLNMTHIRAANECLGLEVETVHALSAAAIDECVREHAETVMPCQYDGCVTYNELVAHFHATFSGTTRDNIHTPPVHVCIVRSWPQLANGAGGSNDTNSVQHREHHFVVCWRLSSAHLTKVSDVTPAAEENVDAAEEAAIVLDHVEEGETES
jgi:hypothetical protein